MNNPYDPDPPQDPPDSFKLSPEREQAMRQLNVWNDWQLRQRYLRAYWKYDQQTSSTWRGA